MGFDKFRNYTLTLLEKEEELASKYKTILGTF